MRTFIAIDLDEQLKIPLFKIIDGLDSGERNVKWVKKQGMHITLKFLGNITDTQKLDVESALKASTEKHKPFPLTFRGIGSFPPGSRRPRVFWIGIDESEPLKVLQKEIEDKLADVGFPKEDRKFHPHLTLGRVKKNINLEPVLAELEKYRKEFFGEMNVEKVIFFQSILKPSGAEYTVLKEFELI